MREQVIKIDDITFSGFLFIRKRTALLVDENGLRTIQGSYASWRYLNLEIKMQGLESSEEHFGFLKKP